MADLIRYITKSHFDEVFSSCFFTMYMILSDTAIEDIDLFFSICLFFLHTITGRNEAIIVEWKALFVLNGTFITFSGGFHHQILRNYEKCCQLSPLQT